MISLVLISSETLFICFHSTASSLYFSLISHLGIPDVKKSKASKPMLEWQDAGQRWVNVSGRAMKKETPKATGQTHISFRKGNSLRICIHFQAAKRTLCLPCRCSCQPFFYATSFSLMHRVKELLQAVHLPWLGKGPSSGTVPHHCLLLFIISVCSFSVWAASRHFRKPA